MIKLSDYVIEFLVKKEIKDIFLVSGGGIMHLLDSVGNNKDITYFCNYHEQACAIAAEGYARMNNHIGVCIVTTGPGSTNALSGIAGAWVDSVPVVVISGQVRRDLIANYDKLRQFGPQEINIIDMVRPITKYAVTVMDPVMIRYELESAFTHATSGRPGPVWINIPLDVQDAMIDEASLRSFALENVISAAGSNHPTSLVSQTIHLLQKAQRPVLILGNGVRQAQADLLVSKFIETVKAPALMTIGGMDLIGENHHLCMGRFGPVGQRRANFALQNSDLVISLGSSLSVAAIGFDTRGFAPHAKKIMVNIDANELHKPSFTPDLAVQTDVKWFIEEFLRQVENIRFYPSPKWQEACCYWRKNYKTVTSDYLMDTQHVNSYVFADILSDMLLSDAVVVTGNSLDIASIYHSFKVKLGQRVFTNINYGAMGWDLPSVIGACVAQNNRRTILVTGDGSFQFNIQELETVSYNRLDIKIFVLNNQGYESIRATQNNFFRGLLVGADAKSGINNPNFEKLAEAYRLQYAYIANNNNIRSTLEAVLTTEGPTLCELNISYTQERSPKTMSVRHPDGTFESRPLEDQYPFLSREELTHNMNLINNE